MKTIAIDPRPRAFLEYLASAVSGDLAYTVAIERSEVRLVDRDTPVAMALRVTHIFRREDRGWTLMLRHADPVMDKTLPDAVLVKSETQSGVSSRP